MSNRLRVACLTMAVSLCWAAAQAGESAYQVHRFDEDYRYRREPARRTDLWDPVKYLPLTGTGTTYLSLGGEARERYEYFNNALWGQGPQTPAGYFLQRYMVHADLHVGEAFRFFAQLKSGLENGRVGGPRPTDKDELDLHQLFGEGKLATSPDNNIWLRLGRQELAFGSQRLVSVREGPNVRQSFDGVRASFTTGLSRMDGFVARPVETSQSVFDDGSDNSRALWGAYAVLPFPLLPEGKIDLYYLGLYRREARFDQGTARETRHSVGTRLWGREAGLDYNFEFVYQFGSFGGSDIQAWTVASDTGYAVRDVPLTPRFGLKANVASGDRDPSNRDLETFNPLFPKGAYFSEANLIGPANFADLHPSIELLPFEQLTVTFDWDFFWRESNRDGIYGNAVNLVRSGQDSRAWYVGSQPQVQLEWRVDRHLTLVAQYAHFLAGPFIKESGPGSDVDYATSWVTYKF